MSNSLTDVYDQIAAADLPLLEKQAEMMKEAEEEDAAGRIMARGFAEELNKLAAPASKTIDFGGKGGTDIKSKKPVTKPAAVAGAKKSGMLGALGKNPFKGLGGGFGGKPTDYGKAPKPGATGATFAAKDTMGKPSMSTIKTPGAPAPKGYAKR